MIKNIQNARKYIQFQNPDASHEGNIVNVQKSVHFQNPDALHIEREMKFILNAKKKKVLFGLKKRHFLTHHVSPASRKFLKILHVFGDTYMNTPVT